jgi:hypothetical protein
VPEQVLLLGLDRTPPGQLVTLREVVRRLELAGAVVVVREGGVRVHSDAPTVRTVRLGECISRAAPALLAS